MSDTRKRVAQVIPFSQAHRQPDGDLATIRLPIPPKTSPPLRFESELRSPEEKVRKSARKVSDLQRRPGSWPDAKAEAALIPPALSHSHPSEPAGSPFRSGQDRSLSVRRALYRFRTTIDLEARPRTEADLASYGSGRSSQHINTPRQPGRDPSRADPQSAPLPVNTPVFAPTPAAAMSTLLSPMPIAPGADG